MYIGSKTVCNKKNSWYDFFSFFFWVIYLCAETAKESIPKMTQSKCEIFVEKVSEKVAHSIVGPTTMNQQ